MQLLEALIDKYTNYYNAEPTVAAMAPGRLELLGNHTDYNEGYVLSCAVNLYTRFVLRPVAGHICRLVDFRSGEVLQIDLSRLDDPPVVNGAGYIKGVVIELMRRGVEVGAFDAAVESDIPLSAGMSSSAALEISGALAIGGAFGFNCSVGDWARIGRAVENDYFGLKSGLLDQLSSLCGEENRILLSDFRSEEVVRTVPMPEDYRIVVVNSMQKHKLVSSEYNVRRQDCEHAAQVLAGLIDGVKTLRDVSIEELGAARSYLDWREFRRAQHVVGECHRVMAGVRMLEEGDVASFGSLWFDSHESSRMNFENSTPNLDYLVSLAKSLPGAVGARLSGGGFGGITVHLVEAQAAEEYCSRISAGYKKHTRLEPDTLILSPGAGAAVWSL